MRTDASSRKKPSRADPTAVKLGAGAMKAARAVPFHDAEELTHQFERLTSEEEGLLKERRALQHDLRVAEDEARAFRDKAMELVKDKQLEAARLMQGAADFAARHPVKASLRNGGSRDSQGRGRSAVSSEQLDREERALELRLLRKQLMAEQPRWEKEARKKAKELQQATEGADRAKAKLDAIPLRYRQSVADVHVELGRVLAERCTLEEELAKISQEGLSKVNKLRLDLDQFKRKLSLELSNLRSITDEKDHWTLEIRKEEVRTVPLRERVSRLKKQVLREFDSDGLCLLAFEGAAKEFEGGEMRMPIGDQAQGVIRAIREYVEPEVRDEVVARIPEAIAEVLREEAFNFYEKKGVTPTELTIHQFNKLLNLLGLSEPVHDADAPPTEVAETQQKGGARGRA